MTTILVTGFGPFPGAPYNPTTPLVQRLARLRRPALAGVKIIAHVFPTSYAAVDRELPELIARHQPDALLMFGLATRTQAIRVETRARNTVSLIPDASARALSRHAIASGEAAARPLPAPVRHLYGALRAARVPAELSHDAGGYLCNYLCWRAADAAGNSRGPRLAAFVHVPLTRRHPRPYGKVRPRMTLEDLTRAGSHLLLAMVTEARR
jgi:pyroglutamyl-peptidase